MLGSSLTRRVVPDSLDVMSVRIDRERRVVTRRVIAIAGTAVVLRTCFEGGLVKGVDLFATACLEGEVRRHHRVFGADPKIGVLPSLKPADWPYSMF